ncbi:MAG: hypothetical protein ACYTGO_21150 [Planctomycetota bacterium]
MRKSSASTSRRYNPSLDLALRISEHFGFPVEFVFSVEPMKPMSQELLERGGSH